jgi:aminopeptidase N
MTPPTKDQPEKVPLLIPVTVGLLGADGAPLAFAVAAGRAKQRSETEAVLLLEGAEEAFVLSGVAEAPTPSLLRNFSAPVNMTVEGQTDEDLSFLLAHDADPFNRCASCAWQSRLPSAVSQQAQRAALWCRLALPPARLQCRNLVCWS